MKKEKQVDLKFNESTVELFHDLEKIKNEHNLIRVNSIMLLKALLQEKNSILYDFLCATSTQQNPYKQIIVDCNEALKKMKGKEKKVEQEETPFILKKSDDDEELSFYVSSDFYTILNATYEMLIEEATEEDTNKEEVSEIIVDTEDLFVIFMQEMPKEALNILKNNGVNLDAIEQYYSLISEMYAEAVAVEDDDDNEKIPKAISDFVTVLSAKYKGVEVCEFLGRDKECQKVMRILQKRGKKNAILIGEPGVGKTSIAEKIAFDIANGNCPESMKDYIVLQLNVNSSVAGTIYRGMAEERFKLLVEFLETHENVILFIDEIHMVIGAGTTAGNDKNDMANALKPFLASKKAKVIGATTRKEYEKYFEKDEAFKRRFEKIIVKEPKAKEVYPMLKNAIKEHEKYHGVKISEDMVQYAVLISSCFCNNTNNPDRTNDLIDSAMVIASERGKEFVDKECILQNFDINFEKFENFEERVKYATAYHEAGHYVFWRKSEMLKDMKGIAISIMPAEDYLGVTVYDDLTDEVTVNHDREYFVDYIAKYLAGRVAEELYTHSINSGASADLDMANKKAYLLVTKLGMSESGEDTNRIYLDEENYHMMSEEIRNKIDAKVSQIIEKATKRAKQIIYDNKKLLCRIVDELMENGILDENDLERICKEEENS